MKPPRVKKSKSKARISYKQGFGLSFSRGKYCKWMDQPPSDKNTRSNYIEIGIHLILWSWYYELEYART